MKTEPYHPIPPNNLGVWSSLSPFLNDIATPSIILGCVASLKLSEDVEFYLTGEENNFTSVQIAFGFSKKQSSSALKRVMMELELEAKIAPMRLIRKKFRANGVIRFKGGLPVAILDHRPGSAIMLALEHQMLFTVEQYSALFNPLEIGAITKQIFMELPAKTYLCKYPTNEQIEVKNVWRHTQFGKCRRQLGIGLWHVFRNKAHFHAWLKANGVPVDVDEYEPLKARPKPKRKAPPREGARIPASNPPGATRS